MLAGELLPNFECRTCTDDLRKTRGCDPGTKAAIPLVMDGENLWNCPRRPYLEDPTFYHVVFEAYSWVQKDMLPDPGTWQDQGHKLLAVFRVIDTAIADARETNKK